MVYERNIVNKKPKFKINVLNPQTLETIQEFSLNMKEENITKRIEEKKLVTEFENKNYDLSVESIGVLYWNEDLKSFALEE